MTVRDTTTTPPEPDRAAQLAADREHELTLLLPAAIRETVRDAGYHPDTKPGERLVEYLTAQAAGGHGVLSVPETMAKAQEWGLAPEGPATDPAFVENAIARARAEGDWKTASILQDQIDRVRRMPATSGPTEDELEAIAEAREQGDYARASELQLQVERRIAGHGEPTAPELAPAEQQPTQGLSADQVALLEDTETPLADRITTARDQGWWSIASSLQERLEKATE